MKFKRTRQTNRKNLSVKETSPCVCVRLFSDHPGVEIEDGEVSILENVSSESDSHCIAVAATE
jgi:hypothetical protein